MSRLASVCALTDPQRRVRIPAVSVSAIVSFVMVLPPKAKVVTADTPATDPNGKQPKPPPSLLSVIPLVPLKVPYNFNKGASDNTITTPDLTAQPIEIPAGCESMLVSLFNAPNKLIPGGIYRIDGLHYTTYCRKGQYGSSMACATISLAPDVNLTELMRSIPFENRSIDLERDVPPLDGDYPLTRERRFLYVKVTDGSPRDDEPYTLYGKFIPPPEGDPMGLSYEPHLKERILALTGGLNGKTADNAQFYLYQTGGRNEEGEIEGFMVLGRCKLYAPDLRRLQIDWLKLGPVVIPHFDGGGLAIIDREASRGEKCERTEELKGALALNVNVHFSMATVAKSCGIKISWVNCLKFSPRLSEPENMFHQDFDRTDVMWTDAINILHFSGDLSTLEGAEKDGLVEFYAFTNADFAPEDMPSEEDEQVAYLLSPKLYRKFSMEAAIFVMVTETYSGRIHDFVSTVPGRPAVAFQKRVKME